MERFNSRAQARFYLEHLGGRFDEYEASHARYAAAVDTVQRGLPRALKRHVIERGFLPNYLFAAGDLVVTVCPDGLVGQHRQIPGRPAPAAVNPDPDRVDGILLPFSAADAGEWAAQAAAGQAKAPAG